MLDNLELMRNHPSVNMKAFYIFEPPIVDPSIYQALPRLTTIFEEVYIRNTHGDGYALDGVDQSKLRRLSWPQPFDHVLTPFWENEERKKKIVVINGNHKPAIRQGELYSKRIEAMAAMSRQGMVDLYGRGWSRWFSRSSMWMPYWSNRKQLMSIYKGPCESKFEVLSSYEFCLCFENMDMDGYMTEKLFDCLYAGCIPIYYGDPNIADYIDSEIYLDFRNFNGWDDLVSYVMSMSKEDVKAMRDKGKEFLESESMAPFYNSLMLSICSE